MKTKSELIQIIQWQIDECTEFGEPVDIASWSEKIGILGNTGLSTGPHVHYEIYVGSKHVDPLKYMILKN